VGRGSNTVDGTSDGGMGNVGRSVVSVHSNNSSRSDSGVMADNIGGVGDALADLVTLGGDHLLAVLDGGDVHVFGADSPGHTSGSVSWDLLALLDRDGVTDRFRDLGRSLVDLGRGNMGANEGGDVPRLGLSVRFGLPLAVVMGGRSHHSLGHS